jgi:hypothetical protein
MSVDEDRDQRRRERWWLASNQGRMGKYKVGQTDGGEAQGGT